MHPPQARVTDEVKGKGEVFQYSSPSVGAELIPVYRQSASHFLSHPGGRLSLGLLSARPTVTFSAEERHHPSTNTKLYCLVTEARGNNLPKFAMQVCPGGN